MPTVRELARRHARRAIRRSESALLHRTRRFGLGGPAPDDWRDWAPTLFPRHFAIPFGPHHEEFWAHVWSIRPKIAPRPFIAVWGRGDGKSTNCEAATISLGTRGGRKYVWYVRGTQDNADTSVENIAALLESEEVARHYPQHSERKVGKYGTVKGWRRNRVRTRGGLTVEAVGLDKTVRGLKVDEQRPDVIIFDDLDGKHDSVETTRKKIATLTTSILPAGSPDCAVIGVQNLIIPEGIFSRLAGVATEAADFLVGRILSGPYPTVRDLEVEMQPHPDTGLLRAVIIGGTPTWEARGMEACQAEIDRYGFSAFLLECQHEVDDREGALWTKEGIARTRVTDPGKVPPLVRIVVGVDPNASSAVGGAECGIITAGLGIDGHVYVFRDDSGRFTPAQWGQKAVNAYEEEQADRIVGEVNQGGEMVERTIRTVEGGAAASYRSVRASRGKQVRAEPISSLWEVGKGHIVGSLPELERQMRTWIPGEDSPDRLDAMVWAATELTQRGAGVPDLEPVHF